jgi:hypothetical protein
MYNPLGLMEKTMRRTLIILTLLAASGHCVGQAGCRNRGAIACYKPSR